jgi:four helix bundle protein
MYSSRRLKGEARRAEGVWKTGMLFETISPPICSFGLDFDGPFFSNHETKFMQKNPVTSTRTLKSILRPGWIIYKNLKISQPGMNRWPISLKIYRCTKNEGSRSDFALWVQVRRAVISVMSRIVEGFDGYRPKEFQQDLSIAGGSAAEVRSQIHTEKELHYLSEKDAIEMIGLSAEIGKSQGD